MHEGMVRKIKVHYNGYNFIFTPDDSPYGMNIISMGRSRIFESGSIWIEDVVLKHKNWIYRGLFNYHLDQDRNKEYEFEIRLSQNTDY